MKTFMVIWYCIKLAFLAGLALYLTGEKFIGFVVMAVTFILMYAMVESVPGENENKTTPKTE